MNNPNLHPDPFSTILRGGLIAGTLDAADAVVVLQYVASGLLGSAAFAGSTDAGLTNAGLRAALHCFMAFVVAAVYYAASLKMPALERKPVLLGLL